MTDPRARVLLGIMLCGCAGAAFLGPQGSGGAPAWRVAGEFFGAALSPAMTTDAGDSLIPIAVAGAWATVKFAVAAMVVALVSRFRCLPVLRARLAWSRLCDREDSGRRHALGP